MKAADYLSNNKSATINDPEYQDFKLIVDTMATYTRDDLIQMLFTAIKRAETLEGSINRLKTLLALVQNEPILRDRRINSIEQQRSQLMKCSKEYIRKYAAG